MKIKMKKYVDLFIKYEEQKITLKYNEAARQELVRIRQELIKRIESFEQVANNSSKQVSYMRASLNADKTTIISGPKGEDQHVTAFLDSLKQLNNIVEASTHN